MKLNLPLYNIMPPTDEESGLLLVSFVEDPAVEVDFLLFSKEEKFSFSIENEEKRIITGPAILADVPIYRRKGDYEFYVNFSKETIRQLVEKYMKQGLSNLINIEHDEETVTDKKAVLVESYFIDKERGICPKEFSSLTDGSWMTSYKILDENLWNFIKQNGAKGFSIEILADIELEHFSDNKKDTENDFDNKVIETFDLAKKSAPKDKSDIEKILDITKETLPNLDVFSEESVRYAITNKKWVMIRYNGTTGTGMRQAAISAMGTTVADNKAIRIYQPYGSTESGTFGWKILRWDEVNDMRVLAFAPSWTDAEIGNTGEAGGMNNGELHDVFVG